MTAAVRDAIEVRVASPGAALAARLFPPGDGHGVVVVPRLGGGDAAAAVCAELARETGLGVLAIDLAAIGEDRLADADAGERLGSALAWLADEATTRGRPLAVFASGALAAAALIAGTTPAVVAVAAVFSAATPMLDPLAAIDAPSLLLAVDGDEPGLAAARAALARIAGDRWLEPVRDAAEAGRAAAAWFAARCGVETARAE